MMDAGPGRKGEGLPKLRDLLRRQREDSLTEVAFRRRPSEIYREIVLTHECPLRVSQLQQI
jgi:hypothetical protein